VTPLVPFAGGAAADVMAARVTFQFGTIIPQTPRARTALEIPAMRQLLEQAGAAEPDVVQARANLTTRRLTLGWRGPAARGNQLAALVARLGFRLAPWSAACLRADEDAEGRELTDPVSQFRRLLDVAVADA
jgi:hypothetical protein